MHFFNLCYPKQSLVCKEHIVSEINPTPESEIEEIAINEPVEEKLKFETAPKADTITISRVTMNYVVIAIVFFAVGILVGAISFRSTSAPVDKELIQDSVSEMLIQAGLMRPIPVMQELADDDPYIGKEDAPVIIVEFSAYACPFCGRHYQETLTPILENYGQYIRYVYRDFPVINQSLSVAAALAADCANEQGKFWDYHDILFTHQTEMQAGDSFFMDSAQSLGLDMTQFTDCYQSQRYIDEVSKDYNDGSKMQLTGTPSFFINGEFVSGAQPYDVFAKIIEQKLAEAGINYKG